MIDQSIWQQSSTTITANQTTGDLSVGGQQEFAFDATIGTLGGTTPSVTFYVDRLGLDGNWYPVWNSGAQTTVGTVSASIGHGMTTNASLGLQCRVRVILGGTSPSVQFSGSLQGK